MSWINPLDLQTILVNILSGSPQIFIAISVIFFAGLAAYFRMTNEIALILLALFFLIMASSIGNVYIILIIVIVALLVYFAISKIVK